MSVMRRLPAWVGFLVVAVVVAVLAFWAGSVVMAPPTLPESAAQVETYEVREGSVGHVEDLGVAATWEPVGVVRAGRDGTLTSVLLRPGDVVETGATLGTVDLEPVVVASGEVPMFRMLHEGVDGPDVRQLQELLADGGYLDAADGVFGADTEAATRAWQTAIGAPVTGDVGPGQVIFVPTLPARMRVVGAVGDRLSPDTELAWLLEDAPAFQATIEAGRRGDLATGDAIAMTAPDGSELRGTLGEFVSQDGGGYLVDVEGVDCGAACDAFPFDGQTMLAGRVVVVPETPGLVVPVSAMTRDASGAQVVTRADGTPQVVTVLAEADGFAVVEGIEPGTRIQLPQSP